MALRTGTLESLAMSFWAGKRVLVTGHTGFKGSWLSLWLTQLGAEVVGYALAPATSPNLFTLARVAEGINSSLGDITDLALLQVLLEQYQPEIIFHLAAQALVRASYQDPVTTYRTNVLGTVHVLEAARRVKGVRAVVVVTSDKCYENQEWVWGYREQDPMGGYDPYSSSKGCAELVTAAYRNSFFNPKDYQEHGLALGSARAGNVLGGGDWATDRLVPDLFKGWLIGQTVQLRQPQALRPWQHVLEPLWGYLLLAQQLYKEGPIFGEGWNFGPLETHSVQTVVKILAEHWGAGAIWEILSQPQLHEAGLLTLDSTKARRQLSWQPKLDLSSTLYWTVDWVRHWQKGADMRKVTLAQIQRYQELV